MNHNSYINEMRAFAVTAAKADKYYKDMDASNGEYALLQDEGRALAREKGLSDIKFWAFVYGYCGGKKHKKYIIKNDCAKEFSAGASARGSARA